MLDIGFSELLVIGGVALVVLGPEKLAVVARTAGKWSGKAQRYVNDVKADIAREGELAELRKLKAEMESAGRDISGSLRTMETSVQYDLTALQSQVKHGVDTAIPSATPSAIPTVSSAALSSEQIDASIQASLDIANQDYAAHYAVNPASPHPANQHPDRPASAVNSDIQPYTPPAVDMTGKYQGGLDATLSAPPLTPAPLTDPITQRMELECLQEEFLRLEHRMTQLKHHLALGLESNAALSSAAKFNPNSQPLQAQLHGINQGVSA
jgi:Tat protein translocase TatB subunit